MIRSLALILALVPLIAVAQDATLVAPTDALAPEEQRQTFHLPPGFEIQLVVAEPAIGQPMNIQFDAAGRLWVTSSVEYPYPADGPGVEPRDEKFAGSDEPHAPRDTVTVIAGIGADGKPQSVTKFVRGLNIPIGLLPLSDGAIVYGIPSVDRHVDTDGDGAADERTALLTGFGNVDTHGMVNGLRRWIDGWIYACHGFRNTSHVKGTDGRQLSMNSGNTFRFQPDGTRLEQFTWGEVNPFGLTFDPLGNLYNADCHSRPLTLLLRGAYYQSFGKPHDGLGFGPEMIDHSHGSTGICGPAYYAATHFPPDYRDNLYLCNPVTGRVHRDKLVWTGSSPMADTQPDFVTSDDPWFRPVDLTVGPDGALYVADFYNAVIGHYEVPLEHPKRDRTTGRIWRIVYVGENGEARESIPTPQDITTKTPGELVNLLDDDNLTIRVRASHELVDRHANEATELLKSFFAIQAKGGRPSSEDVQGKADERSRRADAPRSPEWRTHAMWVLERLGSLDDELLAARSHDESHLVRTHVARLLAEREAWTPEQRGTALRLLGDDDAFVRRAAADALGRHPESAFVRPLLDALAATPPQDTHLVHTIRIALRNVLAVAESLSESLDEGYSPHDLQTLAGIAPAVKSSTAADVLSVILMTEMTTDGEIIAEHDWPTAFGHIVRYGEADDLPPVVEAVRRHVDDLDRQFVLLDSARRALAERGVDSQPVLAAWGEDVATKLLDSSAKSVAWSEMAATADKPTWVAQKRSCADGRSGDFWCSLPNGEKRTGVLRSQPFALPPRLSFYIAGHAGFPANAAHDRNAVRLRDATTGAVLRAAFPPRNDTAQPVEWDLADLVEQPGYLELEDGDTGDAYAWLAVGRFDLDGLNAGGATRPRKAADLIAGLKLTSIAPRLKELLREASAGDERHAAAAAALVALDSDPLLEALVPLLGDPAVPVPLKSQITQATLSRTPDVLAKAVESSVRTLPTAAQLPLAERLAATRDGADRLLSLVEQGLASPRLLTRPTVVARLAAHEGSDFAARITALVDDLPAEDEAIRQLIAARTNAFSSDSADAGRGAAVFTKHCANCHRIGSEGSLVGPQLDGIGIRGLMRLAEDVLDPNRNVDGAFKSSAIVLVDGRVLTGLVRREEGASLVLADSAGKEFRVAKADIEEQVTSPISLMPANVGETIPTDDFNDLMAYLLNQKIGKSE